MARPHVLIRVLVVVLASLTGCLGLLQPTVASSAAPALPSTTFAYDNHHGASVSTDTTTERGPPALHRHIVTAHDAVDHGSHGTSARPGSAAGHAIYVYDDLVPLAQTSMVAGTTNTPARADSGVVSSLERLQVAANTAARACSFTGATVVLMADGTKKPIQEIKVGDKVIATDPETGEQVAKTVEHVFVHDDTVIDLVVDGEVITTTEDHPFWSVTDQRFERADELSPGEKVLGSDGRVIVVSGLKLGTRRDAVAFNLSVEGIHTFHVGDAGILVHNDCIPWSSSSLSNVAGDLAAGARTANVANRSQAEELFLRMYQGKGFTNTTGMSGKQVRDFYGSKAGTYHWDTELTPGLTHSTGPHLQIHQPDGVIIRIFYGGAP